MKTSNIQLPFTTSHAFLIGINDYEHLAPLSTAVNDAKALAETLAADHGYQVHPPLLNASYAEVMQLLEKDLPRLVGQEDRVLFYFAGHGIALDSDGDPKGYIVPLDAKPGEPASLIAMDTFHQAITQLPCKHGLLILDCCFAGAFKWSTGFRDVVFDLPGIIYQERFYQYTQDPAWQVITSSASDQKAVDILSNRTLGLRNDTGAKHSPFAHALLAGLAGEADTVPKEKGDGVITATELYTYLRDRVEDETTEHGKRQSPSMFSLQKHDKGQYIFLHPRHVLNLPPIPDRNPFMGLKSYDEADSSLFYGRDRVITALADLAMEHPLVVVSGASGTGKSSVIKAGLLPFFRKNGWHILPVVRPGKSPMESLQASSQNLKESIKQLLVVDQYEELITQCLNPDDRLAFEAQLADWLTTYPQLRIVISIRSDFEPQFEESALSTWWQNGRYTIPAFSQDELREVIIKPTVQEVLFFEPDTLVDKLVDAVNQAPGALPLLSFTLSELYYAYLNSGRTNRAFTLEDYEKLGGVIGALRTRANAIYDELEQASQDSMRKLMLRMVSLEGGELASRRVASSDLIFSDPKESERLQSVAQQLVTARLISTGVDAQGQTFFEPAHDALVRAWARLWEWIKAQGEGRLGLMYKLSLAVTDYEGNQTNEYLWNDDPRLDLLLADLQNKGHGFNAKEEAFLKKSNALRQRNKRRRWGIVAAVMVGLLGLALFALYEQGQAKQSAREAESAQQLAEDKADEAIREKTRADQEAENARIQADSALTAQGRAIAFGNEASLQRQNAETERDAAERARKRAEQKAREAKSGATAARAQIMVDKDLTIALNLALAALQLEPTEEAHDVLSEILSRNDLTFYQTTISNDNPPNTVRQVIFSPTGERILTGSDDGTVRLYDLSGRNLLNINAHERGVQSVGFSRDGQNIFSVGRYGEVKTWSLSGKLLYSFPTNPGSNLADAIFFPSLRNLLTVTFDSQAKLWSLQDGTLVSTINDSEGRLYPAALSPDERTVLTGSVAGKAKLWDMYGKELMSFTGYQGAVRETAFSPRGDKLVIVSGYNNVATLEIDGRTIGTFTIEGEEVTSAAFDQSGESILIGTASGTLKKYSLTGTVLQSYLTENGTAVMSITPSPRRSINQIVVAYHDGTTKLWHDNIQPLLTIPNLRTFVSTLSFCPDNERFLTAERQGQVKIWRLSGRLEKTFTPHPDDLSFATYLTDEDVIFTASNKGQVSFSDSEGQLLRSFSLKTKGESTFSLSPNGEIIISGEEGGTIKLWNTQGQLLTTVSTNQTGLTPLALASDGSKFLAGSEDGGVRLWNSNGQQIRSFAAHTEAISDLCFSPNGQTILTGSEDRTAKLWSLNGELIQTFADHERGLSSLAFSPDGKTILTRAQGSNAKLWNLTGSLLQTFVSGGGSATGDVAFSRDGKIIYAGSPFESLMLWRNLYAEYLSGTLWNHVYKLTPAEQAEYGIDWEY